MQKQKRTSRQNFREAGLLSVPGPRTGAQEHILDKLGYSLVRRLKDDRGEGIDTVYFVKKEENDR